METPANSQYPSNLYPQAAPAGQQEETFSVKDFFRRCVHNWRWFILAVILCGLAGVLYILRQQPVYQRTAEVLIKDQDAGSSAGDISAAFSSMGLVTSSTTVNNELIQFESPALMTEIVSRLKLAVNYATPGFFHDKTLYGPQVPYEVEFPDAKDTGVSMKLTAAGGKITVSDFETYDRGKKTKHDFTKTVTPGLEPIPTPAGNIIIRPNAGYTPAAKNAAPAGEILVSYSGEAAAVTRYMAELKCALHDRDADVIDITISDVSVRRADDIINTLIEVYNENWVEDKNQVAVATTRFIQDRLGVIENELGDVDSDISRFKADHLVPDLKESARLAMDREAKSDEELLLLESQLQVAKYVAEYVANPAYRDQVIPVITGIGDPALEQQIALYNTVLMDRSHYVANSSESNPVIADYDANLAMRRDAIIKGVRQQVQSLQTAVANTVKAQRKQASTIADAPGQAQYLVSVERQQKVKESLYLFLLQKLEENELTQAFSAYNTRIICPPYGDSAPVSPKKMIILAVAILLGILIPAGVIFIQQSLDTKIRNRKDLEGLRLPYSGEIPLVEEKPSMLNRLLGRRRLDDNDLSVRVREGNRDIVNEAFRVVRSNVDFMLGNDGGVTPVLLVTSYKPGSGKSFISVNLAASFGLKGKKVLLIDGDMRHASVSRLVGSPHKGLSNYLGSHIADWQDCVRPIPETKDVSILPVGTIPPNPAELLESPRLPQLIEEARRLYDIILIDCPPYNLVVDTQIINRVSDYSLFIVRSGLFEKADLPELNAIYDERKLKHISFVLNGTDYVGSSYHYYGGGYYGGGYYSRSDK